MKTSYDGTTLIFGRRRILASDTEVQEILDAVFNYRFEAHKVWIEEQKRLGNVWVAVCAIWGSEHREELYSEEDAVRFLLDGVNNEQLSPKYILRPDGSTITRQELSDLFNKMEG